VTPRLRGFSGAFYERFSGGAPTGGAAGKRVEDLGISPGDTLAGINEGSVIGG